MILFDSVASGWRGFLRLIRGSYVSVAEHELVVSKLELATAEIAVYEDSRKVANDKVDEMLAKAEQTGAYLERVDTLVNIAIEAISSLTNERDQALVALEELAEACGKTVESE